MFTKTTKSQAIEQFKYNWKVYTLRCKREGKKVTKLAKGLASGTDLEYSDFNTLSNAFENRTNIN